MLMSVVMEVCSTRAMTVWCFDCAKGEGITWTARQAAKAAESASARRGVRGLKGARASAKAESSTRPVSTPKST